MRNALAVSLSLLIVTATSAVEAQDQRHHGLWFGFGGGVGQNVSQGLDGVQLTGGGGYLRLGGTPSQKVLLGVEAITWVNEDRHRSNVTAALTWYPSSQGFFLKGGMGASAVARTFTSGNTTSTTTVGGFGVTLGTGVEFKIAGNLYLVPSVDIMRQFFQEQNDPVLGPIPGRNTILVGGIGLLWH